jgi:(p)ppGpp synthase/HD superfamily hydrolase
MNTHRLESAIAYAMRAHSGQTRKGEDIPYIVHPLAVALLLARHGFDEDVVIGGVLHDVVEDTDATLDDIAELFGDSVALLVAAVSHNDALSWMDKKQNYIESVRVGSVGAKAIATADKIANAESLLQSYAAVGPALWERFNAGRDKKLWFEHTMLTMLQETWKHPLVDEYAQYVKRMDELV